MKIHHSSLLSIFILFYFFIWVYFFRPNKSTWHKLTQSITQAKSTASAFEYWSCWAATVSVAQGNMCGVFSIFYIWIRKTYINHHKHEHGVKLKNIHKLSWQKCNLELFSSIIFITKMGYFLIQASQLLTDFLLFFDIGEKKRWEN